MRGEVIRGESIGAAARGGGVRRKKDSNQTMYDLPGEIKFIQFFIFNQPNSANSIINNK